MGRISTSFPLNLSTLNSTYSGGNSLLDYYAGSGLTPSNEAGASGFIPGSSQINLSYFRGATSVNLPGSISSVGSEIRYRSVSADAFAYIDFSSAGVLTYTNDNTGIVGPQAFITVSPTNTWVIRSVSNSIAAVTDNFQIRYTQTSGNAVSGDWSTPVGWTGAPGGIPGTWYTGDVVFSLRSASAAPGDGILVLKTSNGALNIRRADNSTIIASISVSFASYATSNSGDEP